MSNTDTLCLELELTDTKNKSHCRILDCAAMTEAVDGLTGRLLAGQWVRSVEESRRLLGDLHRLRGELASHIEMIEGPQGLTESVAADAPHMDRQVRRLCTEHVCVRGALAEIEGLLECHSRGVGQADELKRKASQLRGVMQEHQHTGNRLVLDAYSSDLGAGE